MRIKATPAAKRVAKERNIDISRVRGTGVTGYIQLADVLRAPKATPLAMAIAKAEGVDIADVMPENGRIRKADVLRHIESRSMRIPVKGMRKVIAERMTSSAQNVPQFTLVCELDAGAMMDAFKAKREEILAAGGVKPTVSDALIMLVAKALRMHPNVNSYFLGDVIQMNGDINVGLAVAADGGLIVPNIKKADKMSLAEVAQKRAELVGKARAKKLVPDEYTGGTCTISNLGQYPVTFFNPLINEPESCILGIGKLTEKPVVVDGKIEIRRMLGIGATFDHRNVDGAAGGEFLATIEKLMAQPDWLR